MTPREAVQLTGYLQAHFPSQPINEFTPDALSELLADYPMADCRRAVLNLANRGSEWCAPTAIAAEVKRIRGKRIADAGDPTPPPDLTPVETIAWLKETRRRIGDGEVIDYDAPYGELRERHLGDLRSLLRRPDDEDGAA